MKKWFVIYTRPQQELKVAEQLSSLGIKTYCPTLKVIKKYSDRNKKVYKPLISCYVMIHLKDTERNIVFDCPGVVRYLFYLGKPAIIHPSEISLMQYHLNRVYNDIKISTSVVGQDYTITKGPFSGISGRVVETNNKKVKLQLESLGMSIILKKHAA